MTPTPVPSPISRESVDALLARVATGDGPGGVVGALHRGRLIVRRAFGLSNLEQGIAVQWNSRLPIGSITKQFTAALVLDLVERRLLSLDDPVGRWLPQLAPPVQAPTLLQLLNHTGGMRCHLDQWMFDGYRTMPPGDPWHRLRRQQLLNFEPGTASSYSNGGYVLLSLAAERAASMPFARLLTRNLLGPLGLHATELPASRAASEHDVARTYRQHAEGWTSPPDMTDDRYGDGGMVSSAGDLLRWAVHLERAVAGRRLLDRFVPRVNAGEPSRYGFGLISQRWRDRWVVQHAGGLPGANSVLMMLPDEELHIVVLLNRPGPAVDLGYGLAERLLGDALAPPLPRPEACRHAGLLGVYRCEETGWVFGFEDDGGSLALGLFGDRSFPLDGLRPADDRVLPFVADIGTGDTWFRVRARDSAGQVAELDYFDGVAWHRALRFARQPVDLRQLAGELAGVFCSGEAGATMRFELRADGLAVQVRGEHGAGLYEAEVWTPDLVRFWPPRFPVSKMVRIERQDGRVTAVVVSTGRTRALRFDRDTAA
ncbi:MAG: beta-lactamase family protein [Proteobacteria bacterium]|nr:beta-lactamase family protein [Pseudomonadota bacterium]